MVCCAVSTAALAGVGGGLIIWSVARHDLWAHFSTGGFILSGMNGWVFATLIGAVVAAPFVSVATWIGAQLKVESMLYYLASGVLSACLLIFLIVGPPRESPFGGTMAAWGITVLGAAILGISWWYLHRRWRAPQRATASGQTY